MVKVIAHRGFSGKFPENTVLAFQKAVELNVDEIEFDVKITKDNKLVLLHDETVDRTTNGKGKVSEMNLREIKELDAGSWFNPEYKGTTIPTFEEALKNIPEAVELNIHALADSQVTEQIIFYLNKYKRVKSAYIAIDASQIPLARKLCPEIRLCNMHRQTSPNKYIIGTPYLEETRRLNCPILQFSTPAHEVTEDLIKKAHSYHLFVNVFYADRKEEMEKLIKYKTDAILTNYPDILISVKRRQDRNEQKAAFL